MTGLFGRDAMEILTAEGHELLQAMTEAYRLREKRHGRSVNLCWIVNARSGHCDQDCGFCSQSRRSDARIDTYPLLEPEEILRGAMEASAAGAVKYSIVTSGGAVREGEALDRILTAVGMIRDETALDLCASLGCVGREVLISLKEAGVTRYHHNMESAESYWPRVCSTRPYDDSRRTVRDAMDVGLEVCSGGIFGMGESLDQRIELLEELRDLGVHSVAINFHVAIPGTPFADIAPIHPMACLRIIIAARHMMPRREIRVCGGREKNMGDVQAMALLAGASGLMIGGYLTTPGRAPKDDIKMIRDLGMVPDAIPDGRNTVTLDPGESWRKQDT